MWPGEPFWGGLTSEASDCGAAMRATVFVHDQKRVPLFWRVLFKKETLAPLSRDRSAYVGHRFLGNQTGTRGTSPLQL
jgi:hypothetical protein